MNYGRAIRICRAAFGIQQAELAARIKIGPSQLSLIEAGKRRPSHEAIEDICRALGIPRSLLSLLAYEPEELEREDDEIVAQLASKLLSLFAEADRQQKIPFRKKDK